MIHFAQARFVCVSSWLKLRNQFQRGNYFGRRGHQDTGPLQKTIIAGAEIVRKGIHGRSDPVSDLQADSTDEFDSVYSDWT